MEKYSNLIPDLPTDILIQVFSRLPVKTLVRLSCVCKFWKDLIRSDRILIGCHLKESLKKTSRSSSNYVLMYSDSGWNREVTGTPKLPIQRFIKADENCLRKKSFFLGSYILLVGCINGVFCLYEFWSGDVYLWNPALHQLRMLPRCCNEFINVVAFFSEPTNDDYMVVKIHKLHSKVHIYKLSSNSWWKRIFPYRLSGGFVDMENMVAIVHNGALHWLSEPRSDDLVFLNVYDPTRKKFHETFLSNHIPFKGYDVKLGLIKGFISVFGRSTANHKYEVWMMKEYGVENSWTKLFAFPSNIVPLRYLPGTGTRGKFVVIVEDYYEEDYVILYDPETKEKEIEFAQDELILLYDKKKKYFFTDNYVESLVSVFPPAKRTVDEPTSVSCSSFPNYTNPQRYLSGTRKKEKLEDYIVGTRD